VLTDLRKWLLGLGVIEKQQGLRASKLEAIRENLFHQQCELSEVKGVLKVLTTMQSSRTLISEKNQSRHA
jgi:DNA-binding MltR family transcriptional regulator